MERIPNADYMVEDGHLGGYMHSGDPATHMPYLWRFLAEKFNVNKMLDIGCGRGFTLEFFKSIGVNVLGVDGCKQAIETSLVPEAVILHDYSKGSFKPEISDFDLAWSCEFVEHVEEKYAANYIATFQTARHLAMTFAGPGQIGHHHVNCQPAQYWIELLGKYGFQYDEEVTQLLRQVTAADALKYNSQYRDNHFINRGLYFINNK
jgi:SAM-dependent methyltransferase